MALENWSSVSEVSQCLCTVFSAWWMTEWSAVYLWLLLSPLLQNLLFFFISNISGEVLRLFRCCNKNCLLFPSEDVCYEAIVHSAQINLLQIRVSNNLTYINIWEARYQVTNILLHLKQTIYNLQGRCKAGGMVVLFHSAKWRAFSSFLLLVSCNLKDLNRKDRMHWKIKKWITYLLMNAINSNLSFVLALSFRYYIPWYKPYDVL